MYLPLARKYRGKWQRAGLTIFVYLVIGLWHGAAWNFVWFGLYAGVTLAIAGLTIDWRQKHVPRLLPVDKKWFKPALTCYQILFVNITYISTTMLFRANRAVDIPVIFTNLFTQIGFKKHDIAVIGFARYELLIALCAILLLELVQWEIVNQRLLPHFETRSRFIRWPIYYGLLCIILMFGEFRLIPFIYFQF
jgi:D-alanyl-lipoteichoic acid acyltransferase DltB (MBOAT superfamily)